MYRIENELKPIEKKRERKRVPRCMHVNVKKEQIKI